MPTKAYKTASAVSFSLKTFTVLNSESYILSAVFVLFSCCFGKQSATREAVDQKEQEVARLKPGQLDFQTLKKSSTYSSTESHFSYKGGTRPEILLGLR